MTNILKWTDHKVNFFSLAAADLFNEEDLTDVTICCGEKLFDAHKLILSACSPYFKSMLTHKKKLNKVKVLLLLIVIVQQMAMSIAI